MTTRTVRQRITLAIIAASLSLAVLTPAAHADTNTPDPAPTVQPTTEPAPVDPTAAGPVVTPPAKPTTQPTDPAIETAKIRKAHSQLAYLGYPVTGVELDHGTLGKQTKAGLKKFQTKFGYKVTGKLDKATIKGLNKYAGDAVLPKRCVTGEFTICVNKYNKTLTAVSANGNVLKVIDARYGRPGLETREGNFHVQRMAAVHTSTLYGASMPYSLFFSRGEAVHYSYEYARYPNTLSHGCVGTRNWDAQKWLFYKSHIGTPVIVYNEKPR